MRVLQAGMKQRTAVNDIKYNTEAFFVCNTFFPSTLKVIAESNNY